MQTKLASIFIGLALIVSALSVTGIQNVSAEKDITCLQVNVGEGDNGANAAVIDCDNSNVVVTENPVEETPEVVPPVNVTEPTPVPEVPPVSDECKTEVE